MQTNPNSPFHVRLKTSPIRAGFMKRLLSVISFFLIVCVCSVPIARTEAFKRLKRAGQSGLRALLPAFAEASNRQVQEGESDLRALSPTSAEASKGQQPEGPSSLRQFPDALAVTSQ